MSAQAYWTLARVTLASALFPPEEGPLHRDGTRIRNAAGALYQCRSFSLFLAFYRFVRGEDLRPDLRWLRAFGFNTIRVFGPLDWDELTDYHHGAFPLHRLAAFFGLCAEFGLRVEFVPICYPFKLDEQQHLLQGVYNIARHFPLVHVEGVNEPRRKIKGQIKADVLQLFQGINRHGVLTAYGEYPLDGESYSSVPICDFGTTHLPRVDGSWARKARIAQELQHSTGYPWISDEPTRAEETDTGSQTTSSMPEYVHHVGICHLFTPGACTHTSVGKFGHTPDASTPKQLAICEGLRDHVFLKIGPEWQTGIYVGSDSKRTSPVNFEYNVWAYSSILGDRAMSVRVDTKPSTAVNGWHLTETFGPDRSLASLAR